MAAKNNDKKEDIKKPKFGDIIENHDLIKRTLMVAAFPALVKTEVKHGKKVYSGFLPGFEFSEVDGFFDIGECMQTLQDILDDCVEELVVFDQQLPELPSDEQLLFANPGYEVKYLDINVYALPDEEGCDGDCKECNHKHQHHHQHDDNCECGHHHHCDCNDDNCDCNDEDCDCGDDCDCDDDDCDCE